MVSFTSDITRIVNIYFEASIATSYHIHNRLLTIFSLLDDLISSAKYKLIDRNNSTAWVVGAWIWSRQHQLKR